MNGFALSPHLASHFNVGGPDLIILLALLGSLFFIWMLVDCVNNEPTAGNSKLIWTLIIVLVPFGSLLYFFIRKLQRA